MEDLPLIYPPNKPFDRVIMTSSTPVLYDQLMFLYCGATGRVLLGSSNLAGTCWEGILLLYDTMKKAVENDYAGYVVAESPILDAKFINNCDLVLVAENNNSLQLFNATAPSGDEASLKSLDDYENNGSIERISTWKDSKFVTCSQNAITLWDINDGGVLDQLHNYSHCHVDAVTDVDVNVKEVHNFVSVSHDRKTCIWDTRLENAAKVFYTNEICSLTATSWGKNDDNLIAVGSEAGDVYVFDKRQENNFLYVARSFDANVHRLDWHPELNVLGVCGDINKVVVYSLTEDDFREVYTNESHKDVVRGITWFKGDMFTCGFDKNIYHHVI